MTIDSHNPTIHNLNERDPVYNLTLDYKGYALSLYLRTPAELCVFGPRPTRLVVDLDGGERGEFGDRRDFTAEICEALDTDFIHCTAEGIRDVMNVIDRRANHIEARDLVAKMSRREPTPIGPAHTI
jgi:hypothetical protein